MPLLGSTALAQWEDEVRHLWEATPESAAEIARRYGVSKNIVIGVAYRRCWRSFNRAAGPLDPLKPYSRAPWPYERTMEGRLERLHAKLEAVLNEDHGRLVSLSRAVVPARPRYG